jgi:hypothetical protein
MKCKVCSSLNRTDYEKMFIEGHSFREISRSAFSRYNELISPKSFERHMKKHLAIYISEKRRIEARNLKFYFEKARSICKEILDICNKVIEKKLRKEEMSSSSEEISQDPKLLLQWIENKRAFTMLLYELEKLNGSETSKDQDLENRILQCAREVLPQDVYDLFVQRWYNYNKDTKNVQVSQ